MLLWYYSTGKNGELIKSQSLYNATPLFEINMPDGEKAPVFDYKAFPFEIFTNAPLHSKKGKTRDHAAYYDIACSFDIETTTIEEQKTAFMYQWQFAIEDYVFMGKTWEQFQEMLIILHDAFKIELYETEEMFDGKPAKILHGNSLVCYIFNLQFEFMFMQHFIGETVSPLMTDIYEPLIVPTALGITYRCAYRLTNKSLEKFTKGFPHAKLAGDLDYSLIRTPIYNDPKNGLTDLELAYCYNDVKGLNEAMRDRLQKDKYNIASIPLTSTGYVRKDCQASMRKNPKMRAMFLETKLTPYLYSLCRLGFRGGNTHSNAAWTAKTIGYNTEGDLFKCDIITGPISHYDITSSYPAQILTKDCFPRTPFKKVNNPNSILSDILNPKSKYCYLLTLRMWDIQYIGNYGVPYLAKAKTMTRTMDKDQIIEDNGRIYKAPLIQCVCTEIDARLILEYYSKSKIEIIEAYSSLKGMLPYELRRVCLEYYKTKCELSGTKDPDKLYERAKAKENLNSIYGLCCMKIDRTEYEYDHGIYNEVRKPLAEMLTKFYDSESSFLPYQYSLWITSAARAALDQGCRIAGPDLVYCDTDSVFCVGDHQAEFETLNAELEATARKYGAIAANPEGKEYPIGIWERDQDVKIFRTLGAKKYLCSYDGHTIESTIAGVSKNIGAEYFTKYGFDKFSSDAVIPTSGKVSAHYNNDKPHYIEVNGVRILTASNIALINAPYTINLKKDYRDFISMIRKSLEMRRQNRNI